MIESRRAKTHNDGDLIEFTHAAIVLLGGACAVVYELPHLAFWSWRDWFLAPTSPTQTALFTLSALYFGYDMLSILLLRRGRRSLSRKHVAILVHHTILVLGLVAVCWYGQDGTVMLLGLLIGQSPNPTRLLSRVLGRMQRFPDREKWTWERYLEKLLAMKEADRARTLVAVHVFVFVGTRVMFAHYIAHTILPYAQLTATKVTALMHIIFSFLAMWEYLVGNSVTLLM